MRPIPTRFEKPISSKKLLVELAFLPSLICGLVSQYMFYDFSCKAGLYVTDPVLKKYHIFARNFFIFLGQF